VFSVFGFYGSVVFGFGFSPVPFPSENRFPNVAFLGGPPPSCRLAPRAAFGALKIPGEKWAAKAGFQRNLFPLMHPWAIAPNTHA
jgi:hypothetical protein